MMLLFLLFLDLFFWKFVFRHISTVFRLSRDWAAVSGGGIRSTCQKPPPNPKSLAILLHDPARIQTRVGVRDG